MKLKKLVKPKKKQETYKRVIAYNDNKNCDSMYVDPHELRCKILQSRPKKNM